ncbi:hypothetical protein Pcinc_021153 [Petrolisthes cinctipes]|uniref:Uncharacterized protein n=1 Tax=Petrolisthes cinctipes TaxID=88211 RepID=A0AAE1KIU2_PETCI|nr:hypothetical protein Pcinc_021153 [Petrolisthes cinctipes]
MKTNHHHQYSLRPVQKSETILTFSHGFDNYLMYLASNEAYQIHVWATVQRWCGKAVLLLTGERTKLLAYVWNGSSQKFILDYSIELSVAVKTWTTGYGFIWGFQPHL